MSRIIKPRCETFALLHFEVLKSTQGTAKIQKFHVPGLLMRDREDGRYTDNQECLVQSAGGVISGFLSKFGTCVTLLVLSNWWQSVGCLIL
jgi:hypothetical protein